MTQPKTIYLHAGTPKTGTTALQRFLASNRDLLARRDLAVPDFLGAENHTRLAAYALNDDKIRPVKIDLKVTEAASLAAFREKLERDFRKKLSPRKSYVMSNEHCGAYLHTKGELERLHGLLTSQGHQIKIIMYFREPCDYLASTHSTLLKNGATNPMQMPSRVSIKRKYDYLEICRRWGRTFGEENIVARLFVRDAMAGGSIIPDFLQALGFDAAEAAEAETPVIDANRSVDHLVAGFLTAFNEHLPRYLGNTINRDRADFGQICEVISTRERILVGEDIREPLYAALEDSLGRFNKRFIGGKREWPFPPYKPDGKAPIRMPGETEMLEIFSAIWREKHRRAKAMLGVEHANEPPATALDGEAEAEETKSAPGLEDKASSAETGAALQQSGAPVARLFPSIRKR